MSSKIKYSCLLLLLLSFLFGNLASAEEIFIEAETFDVSGDGWQVVKGGGAKKASMATSLWGATGSNNSIANKQISITKAGDYRLWVRYIQFINYRGPFTVAVYKNNNKLAEKHFDLAAKDGINNDFLWEYFDLELPVGEITLKLNKYNNQKCPTYTRHVDCFLLTTDKELIPDHIKYGPQTYMRVTLSDVYDRPLYVHIFADHYRAPWYGHYSISKDGIENRISPSRSAAYFASGEQTPWCNITPMLYQDSGAILIIRTAYSYAESTPKLKAKFEFATAPNAESIVKVIERESEPAYMHIVMPPDFTTSENVTLCKMDSEYAFETGQIADNMIWPTVGKKPTSFPFFVSTYISPESMDLSVVERELQTLANFGFNGPDGASELLRSYGFKKTMIHGGLWGDKKNNNYLEPELTTMRSRAQTAVKAFKDKGGRVENIDYCMLTDEPQGAPTSQLVTSEVSKARFRSWLVDQGINLLELLPGVEGIVSWDLVRPVLESEQDQYPALHYYTQKFRTYSLGDFMAVQKDILHEAYGSDFPVNVNFSDGAIYYANFYGQGVDYFELMEATGQNAIWSEDWANISSTYQCGTYNVDLMRAAARRANAHVGNYLIAHAGRRPWDTKLKGISTVARGVKTLRNFHYGPSWAGHEGGMWYVNTGNWYANAELVHEIGGAEDLLSQAKPMKADVAILYSSSTDIWTLGKNYAYGFDRMHTWLALAHAQIPVDILSERDIEDGVLDGYKVCYFSGPNLTRKAADKLKTWLDNGGTLVLTAGAGSKDEYNQPLTTLEEVLPVTRGSLEEMESFLASGRYLDTLKARDNVLVGSTALEVLSVRQRLTSKADAEVLGTFGDGSAALIKGSVGAGTVYSYGFLPSLYYIKEALVARKEVEKRVSNPQIPVAKIVVSDEELIGRSYNPWKYPQAVRDVIIMPLQEPCVKRPLKCSVPLVDAVLMESTGGLVIPLANYTLQPLAEVKLEVRVAGQVGRIESIHHGQLIFKTTGSTIEFSLPLQETDIIKIYFAEN